MGAAESCDPVCGFDNFIELYTKEFINRICNVIDSYDIERKRDLLEEDIEGRISECIVNAWNNFTKLTPTHPSDIDDFNRGIHDLQKVIGMRELRRLKPEKYPCK